MFRRLTAALAALALLLILAVPVAAGGWAEIVADAQTTTTDTPPTEGQPIDIGFLVLQHGTTPAGWETATVHFRNAGAGQSMDVVGRNDRPDGHSARMHIRHGPDHGFTCCVAQGVRPAFRCPDVGGAPNRTRADGHT